MSENMQKAAGHAVWWSDGGDGPVESVAVVTLRGEKTLIL